MEFKVAKRRRGLEEKAEEALRQIEERNYAAELYDEDYDRVSCYGIAFCGKECLVKVRDARQVKKIDKFLTIKSLQYWDEYVMVRK